MIENQEPETDDEREPNTKAVQELAAEEGREPNTRQDPAADDSREPNT